MYKEFLKENALLEEQINKLLQEIWKNQSSENKLESLLRTMYQLRRRSHEFNSAIRVSENTKNYIIINEWLMILECLTKENWQVDYTIKIDELEKEYIFVYLKKEEVNLEKYSYEYLSLEHTNGNFQDDFLIYDKFPKLHLFDFSSYLMFGHVDIKKYLRPNYYFSPHYPALQKFIQNMVMEEYDYIHSKNKVKKRK